ncbi:MAG: hypothetical protein RIT14_1963, partial [Pseudomonadota bacterium]
MLVFAACQAGGRVVLNVISLKVIWG